MRTDGALLLAVRHIRIRAVLDKEPRANLHRLPHAARRAVAMRVARLCHRPAVGERRQLLRVLRLRRRFIHGEVRLCRVHSERPLGPPPHGVGQRLAVLCRGVNIHDAAAQPLAHRLQRLHRLATLVVRGALACPGRGSQ